MVVCAVVDLSLAENDGTGVSEAVLLGQLRDDTDSAFARVVLLRQSVTEVAWQRSVDLGVW